ncbi:hypothetical protein [Kitasatospora sp. NPDC056531]|uniref:hypothetical protein n=1 Tax=Kitasatospora sp. NPDC056531 TaxID=3345856 RepID=UPI003698C5C7
MTAPTDPAVDRIVHTIEQATISQLQQAFRQLGWPIRIVVADDPQASSEEPQ